jgi:hypothetical protein
MANTVPIFRYRTDSISLEDISAPVYPVPTGSHIAVDTLTNPQYITVNRELPSVSLSWKSVNLK